MVVWAVLTEEQMSIGYPFSRSLNDEHFGSQQGGTNVRTNHLVHRGFTLKFPWFRSLKGSHNPTYLGDLPTMVANHVSKFWDDPPSNQPPEWFPEEPGRNSAWFHRWGGRGGAPPNTEPYMRQGSSSSQRFNKVVCLTIWPMERFRPESPSELHERLNGWFGRFSCL